VTRSRFVCLGPLRRAAGERASKREHEVDYLLLQVLNGVQLGLLMFLLAAGLTLTFGIMDLVNLAHGSLYMMGAYIAWTLIGWTDSFMLGVLLALPATFLLGVVVEAAVMRRLYGRDHLDQVLATFGLILFFNELVRAVWGPAGKSIAVPAFLARTVEILPGVPYPAYRFAIIVTGAAVAALLAWLVARTRLGMLIRAGASNRRMIGALGVNIELLFSLVFGLGAVFAGLAGLMAAPLSSVKIGMGDDILIVAFVIIVIGGIGSIKGAFVAAMVVGQIDIIGRAFLPDLLKTFLSNSAASSAAPAISQVLVYIVMAGVLVWRPTGLFGQRT
jgi:branched-chain amino acid transport system permease protein